MFCTKCGKELLAGASFCTACGAPVPKEGGESFDLRDKLREVVGVEKLEGFSFRRLMSEAFKRHPIEEVEDSFTVGTMRNTPSLLEVEARWPRPWMFCRSLLGTLFLYGLFSYGYIEFKNLNLIPGLIAVGTLAVPLSALIFFFEVNVLKNVSVYQLMRMTVYGGMIAVVGTLLLYALIPEGFLGAIMVGLVEEAGKLIALLTVSRSLRYNYKLNGLLLGAAVGAGFAVFESMGYSFRALLAEDGGVSDMHVTIILRGLLSPFAHIAWTAMCGAAMWRVKGEEQFRLNMVKDARFLKVFLFAVASHAIWDMDFEIVFPVLKALLLGIAAWTVVLSLIQEGIREVRERKHLLELK